MVIDRGAMLSGDYAKVFDEIAATKEACGPAHLKVILETGELGTYDLVRKASEIGIAAGGDFIKTSTGKVTPAATPPVTLVMLEAIRDHFYATGRRIGMKPAGGVRTAKQALHYLVLVKETLGDAVAHAGPVPLRRERAPERRAHADRKRADRQLPGCRGLLEGLRAAMSQEITKAHGAAPVHAQGRRRARARVRQVVGVRAVARGRPITSRSSRATSSSSAGSGARRRAGSTSRRLSEHRREARRRRRGERRGR